MSRDRIHVVHPHTAAASPTQCFRHAVRAGGGGQAVGESLPPQAAEPPAAPAAGETGPGPANVSPSSTSARGVSCTGMEWALSAHSQAQTQQPPPGALHARHQGAQALFAPRRTDEGLRPGADRGHVPSLQVTSRARAPKARAPGAYRAHCPARSSPGRNATSSQSRVDRSGRQPQAAPCVKPAVHGEWPPRGRVRRLLCNS